MSPMQCPWYFYWPHHHVIYERSLQESACKYKVQLNTWTCSGAECYADGTCCAVSACSAQCDNVYVVHVTQDTWHVVLSAWTIWWWHAWHGLGAQCLVQWSSALVLRDFALKLGDMFPCRYQCINKICSWKYLKIICQYKISFIKTLYLVTDWTFEKSHLFNISQIFS